MLFDVCLARRGVSCGVRTTHPALVALLRGAQGTSVLQHPDLNAAIVAAGPARVPEREGKDRKMGPEPRELGLAGWRRRVPGVDGIQRCRPMRAEGQGR